MRPLPKKSELYKEVQMFLQEYCCNYHWSQNLVLNKRIFSCLWQCCPNQTNLRYTKAYEGSRERTGIVHQSKPFRSAKTKLEVHCAVILDRNIDKHTISLFSDIIFIGLKENLCEKFYHKKRK